MNSPRPSRIAPSFLGTAVAALLVLGCPCINAQDAHGNATQGYAWTTFAGTPGVHGMAAGTGPAARFGSLTDIAVDARGNLYVADISNNVLWKITPAGEASVLYSYGINSQGPVTGVDALAADPSGGICLLDGDDFLLAQPGGTVSTIADVTGTGPGYFDGPVGVATIGNPRGLVVDPSGNIYFTDYTDYTVRELSTVNIVSTLAGFDTQFGNQDGTGSAAHFTDPYAITIDSSGNLYVTDTDSVRKIVPNGDQNGGVVTTFAGMDTVAGYVDGDGTAARFFVLRGIAIDAANNLYVTSEDNTIRMITPAGVVSTIGGTSASTGSTNGVGQNALFNSPQGIAVDSAGDVFVVDQGNAVIRKYYAAGPASPTLGSQPASQSVAVGTAATFTVTAAGVPAPTYQWLLNGNYVAGATNPSLTIPDVQATNLGAYTVVVSNANGSVTSSAATLSSPGVTPATAVSAAMIVNISTRAQVLAASDVEIVGFVVAGAPGSTEKLLIRGDGSTLGSLGISDSLGQPTLTLYDASGKQLASNTNFTTSPAESQIVAAAAASGAFPLVPEPAGVPVWDSALLVTLTPGTYTAEVSPDNGTPGVGLAEVYAVGANTARLANISTRAFVGTGQQVAIAGLSIAGSQSTTVLVRAVGPTLSQFSVSGALANPVLTVTDSAGNTVGTNTGWTNNANAAQIAQAASSAGAFALQNPGNDSALLLTLQPGNYTAVVSGAGGTSGVALVEVYQLQ